eukprot:GFYU01011402.1.p1 GENE.GFYU01011402.1~~GFYU01011402.1.p1  ORF type:complete len:148 (-),score=50.21 GFYU01011402.1:49-492(-)
MEYAENEVNDPFVQKFIAGFEKKLKPFQNSFTDGNFDALAQLLIKFTANHLETVVMKKRFNQLGGLQFDKDVRSLVSYLTTVSTSTVRDKFARLTQIALLLNLEKVHEVLEYWDDSSMTWRLTKAEVKRVLALRSDFSSSSIQKLKL